MVSLSEDFIRHSPFALLGTCVTSMMMQCKLFLHKPPYSLFRFLNHTSIRALKLSIESAHTIIFGLGSLISARMRLLMSISYARRQPNPLSY